MLFDDWLLREGTTSVVPSGEGLSDTL